ncbi:hypothetical protein BRC93_16370 [Halobacteriales archaeon QS_5_70_15]|nr:MAG: hypothetical protein BRC93_16370 [Halobacteriales archaeon QS_5_70_15]
MHLRRGDVRLVRRRARRRARRRRPRRRGRRGNRERRGGGGRRGGRHRGRARRRLPLTGRLVSNAPSCRSPRATTVRFPSPARPFPVGPCGQSIAERRVPGRQSIAGRRGRCMPV